jgi:hypothetical protein
MFHTYETTSFNCHCKSMKVRKVQTIVSSHILLSSLPHLWILNKITFFFNLNWYLKRFFSHMFPEISHLLQKHFPEMKYKKSLIEDTKEVTRSRKSKKYNIWKSAGKNFMIPFLYYISIFDPQHSGSYKYFLHAIEARSIDIKHVNQT